MRCASLRTTVDLSLAGLPVWSVHHMFGPFPTSYTWGYYRADVSCVFGTGLETAYLQRKHAWAQAWTQAHACNAKKTHGSIAIFTAESWISLRTCFHIQMNDPP